jgi:hypothetical protein
MRRSLQVAVALLACAGTSPLLAQYDDYHLSAPSNYADYDYYADAEAQPSPSDLPADELEIPQSEYQPLYDAGSYDTYSDCNSCDCWCDPCEPWRLFPPLPLGFNFTGWVAAGATANDDSPVSRFNGPLSFNDRNEFQMNQLYGVLERPIDTSDYCFDVGGRIDLLFGTDYIFTEAVGLETERDGSPKWNNRRFYGLAMPQAYGEIGWMDLSVKVGHFYSPIRYESVMAPNQFFYSHAYTFQYGEPFTFTGALATHQLTDQLTTYAGVHSGWDIFDRFTERAGLMGGFSWTNYDDTFTLSFGSTTGDELNNVGVYSERTMYSIVAAMQLTERLRYVLQHDNGWQEDFFAPGVDAEWYGINNYLFYTINSCWVLGARYEWFRDDDGVRVTGIRPTNPIAGDSFVGDFHEVSLGVNWIPTNNLRIRPEIRYDWFDGTGLPFDDASDDDQFTAAMDAILLW